MIDGWLGVVHATLVGLGVLAFAISGAQLAAEKRMDVVGMAFLAVVTATGGGMLRDLLVGRTPVVLVDVWMVGVAVAGAAIVFALHRWIAHLARPVLVFDAIGLGIFCVEGTIVAMDAGIGPVGAAIVGMLTGVGGGILRDVLGNDIPTVMRRESRLYLLPALTGAALTALLVEVGVASTWVLVGVGAAVIAFRLLAERFRWRVPALSTTVLPVVRGDGASPQS